MNKHLGFLLLSLASLLSAFFGGAVRTLGKPGL